MLILSSNSSEKFYLDKGYYLKLGLIKVNKKVYSIYNLPEGLKIKGNLNLNFSNTWKKITKLPKNLTVTGWLDLSYNFIKILPEGLKVGGDLDLEESKIIKIPPSVKIEGSLNLSGCEDILELPDGLTIGESLYIEWTNIEILPERLNIKGSIIGFKGNKKDYPQYKFE